MTFTEAGMPVDALVASVKEATIRGGVSQSSAQSDLCVKSIQLILRTIASRTSGGELDFRIPVIGMKLRAGARITDKDIHTIDMVLKPSRSAREVRGGSVDDTLVDAILTIRRTMALAAGGDDPWTLSAGTVELSFGVTESGSISLAATGEVGSELIQTLRITLTPTADGS